MQKQYSLKKNSQFRYVYRRGIRASCSDMTLLYVRNKHKSFGFSVSKKVGCAVVRNTVKRRMRECVRPIIPNLKSGLYVIVIHPCASEKTLSQLNNSLESLIRRMKLFC